MTTQHHNKRLPLKLAKPIPYHPLSPSSNIFHNQSQSPQLPPIAQYHLIGPTQLRSRILSLQQTSSHQPPQEKYLQPAVKDLNQTHSTINRNTILTKIEKDQQNSFTRETRIKNRYKEYQSEWSRQSSNIKSRSQSNSYNPHHKRNGSHKPTLLENAVKRVYVHPNRDKSEIISTNVTRYWEMSLRNNSKTLKLYMKGTKYEGLQLEELLQTQQGTKEVQRSIPTLKQNNYVPITIHGKRVNQILGRSETTYPYKEEVLKADYDSRNNFIGTEGLSIF